MREWQAYASSRGLTYEPARRLKKERIGGRTFPSMNLASETLRGVVRGVEVVLQPSTSGGAVGGRTVARGVSVNPLLGQVTLEAANGSVLIGHGDAVLGARLLSGEDVHDVLALLGERGSAELDYDTGAVRVRWTGLEVDPHHLDSAMQLVSTICLVGPAGGPYR